MNKAYTISKKIRDLLPDEEVYRTYSILEFIEWVDSKKKSLVEARDKSKELHESIREGHRRSDKFFDEFMHIRDFLSNQKFLGLSWKIKLTFLSQKNTPYDAKVTDDNGNEWFIEVTEVDQNEEEYLRRVLLNQKKMVGTHTRIYKSPGGPVEDDSLDRKHQEIMADLFKQTEKRLEEKHKRADHYKPNTLLVLSVGNLKIFQEEDKTMLSELIGRYKNKIFADIFFVNLDGSPVC